MHSTKANCRDCALLAWIGTRVLVLLGAGHQRSPRNGTNRTQEQASSLKKSAIPYRLNTCWRLRPIWLIIANNVLSPREVSSIQCAEIHRNRTRNAAPREACPHDSWPNFGSELRAAIATFLPPPRLDRRRWDGTLRDFGRHIVAGRRSDHEFRNCVHIGR